MSITREYTEFYLVCDHCLTELHFDSWDDALRYAKHNGWEMNKVGDHWEHICPECEGIL